MYIFFHEQFQIWRPFCFVFFPKANDYSSVSASLFLLSQHAQIGPFKEKITMRESHNLSKQCVPRTEHLEKEMFGDVSNCVTVLPRMLQEHHLPEHLHLHTKNFANQISTFSESP